MNRFGLRTRLTLIYTALFAIVLGALAVISYRTLAALLDNRLNEQLEEMSAGLRGYLNFPGGVPVFAYDADDPEQAYFAHTAGRYLEIYDSRSGALIYQSPEMRVLDLELSAEEVRNLGSNPSLGEIESERIDLRVQNTFLRPDERHEYVLRVGLSLAPNKAALHQFRRTMLLVCPLGVLLASAAGWWMARRALLPVERLGHAAHEISISSLDRRLPLPGTGDELENLAVTFNDVFARLDKAVQQMREFTASVSHELRTPLAALRGEAEVALAKCRSAEEYQHVLESQLEEFDKLTRMVNDLLTLARAEAGEIPLRSERVDLAVLARAAVDLLQPLADEHGLSLAAEVESAAETSGDPQWLESVILNLLDNAIKFTGEGGSVRVLVNRLDGRARLTVSDTGIGIPSESFPHIFEPFYRADSSRSRQIGGVGLGLALVHWVVAAHGGRIDVNSQPSQGTRITILFPPASSQR